MIFSLLVNHTRLNIWKSYKIKCNYFIRFNCWPAWRRLKFSVEILHCHFVIEYLHSPLINKELNLILNNLENPVKFGKPKCQHVKQNLGLKGLRPSHICKHLMRVFWTITRMRTTCSHDSWEHCMRTFCSHENIACEHFVLMRTSHANILFSWEHRMRTFCSHESISWDFLFKCKWASRYVINSRSYKKNS